MDVTTSLLFGDDMCFVFFFCLSIFVNKKEPAAHRENILVGGVYNPFTMVYQWLLVLARLTLVFGYGIIDEKCGVR